MRSAPPALAAEAAMVSSASAPTPRLGDVVVSCANKSHRYALTTFGEAPQLICTTREEATAEADRFARAHHVDVWETADGRAFTKLFEARLTR